MRKVNDARTDDGQTDGRTTDNGQRVITIVYLSLRLRCTKKARKSLPIFYPEFNVRDEIPEALIAL